MVGSHRQAVPPQVRLVLTLQVRTMGVEKGVGLAVPERIPVRLAVIAVAAGKRMPVAFPDIPAFGHNFDAVLLLAHFDFPFPAVPSGRCL